MFKLRRNHFELFILSIVYLIILFHYSNMLFGDTITFNSTDSLMRVIRIKEFFQHHDLSNYIIARSNYPFGCDLHWTRLYDFLLIGLTYSINFFVHSIDKSIIYASFVISPILAIVAMLFMYKIFGFVLEQTNVFLATVLFVATPYLLPIFAFGHPDHHSFISLCIIFYIYSTAKMILDKSSSYKYSILTAIAATACVWASPETLIVLILTDITLFFAYMHDYKKVETLLFKTLITTCLISTVTMFPIHQGTSSHGITLCLVLLLIQYIAINQNSLVFDSIFRSWHFVCLMMMLLFIPSIRPVEYDKISIVHTTLFLSLSVFFAVNLRFVNQKNQIKNIILWAFVVGVIFLCLFPRFLMGMSADITPYVKRIWLSSIVELQSPFAGDLIGTFSLYSIFIITAIIVKIKEIKAQKLTNQNIIWLVLISLASCYWILACCACRMIPYSILFGLPLLINLGMSSDLTKKYYRLTRILITVCISFLFVFIPSIISSANESSPENQTETSYKQYTDKELYTFVNNLSETPVTIMAHSNHGPKILYYTKHHVLGAPYHRQEQGIIFSYRIMEKNKEKDNDEKLALNVLHKTNSTYLFINHKLQKKYPKSYASNILQAERQNKLPNYIEPVVIPKRFVSDYSIFKINQKTLLEEIKKLSKTPKKEDQPKNSSNESAPINSAKKEDVANKKNFIKQNDNQLTHTESTKPIVEVKQANK